MFFTSVLTRPDVVFAIAVYASLALLEPFIEVWTRHIFADNSPFEWSWEHLITPLMRAGLVLLFIYLAYPALFGLQDAPSFAQLTMEDDARTSKLLGILYLVTLVAPMLPLFSRHPEFVLPLQGCLAAAFVFHWLCNYLHITSTTLLPSLPILGAMLVSSYVAHRIGRGLSHVFVGVNDYTDRHYLIEHVITLLAQIPVVVIYTSDLGRQIAI